MIILIEYENILSVFGIKFEMTLPTIYLKTEFGC